MRRIIGTLCLLAVFFERCKGFGLGIDCSTGCNQCDTIIGNCTQCQDGFFPVHTELNTTCDACLDNCRQCTNSNTCQACEGYFTLINNACVSCNESGCLSCSSANFCNSCTVGYTLQSDGTCKELVFSPALIILIIAVVGTLIIGIGYTSMQIKNISDRDYRRRMEESVYTAGVDRASTQDKDNRATLGKIKGEALPSAWD